MMRSMVDSTQIDAPAGPHAPLRTVLGVDPGLQRTGYAFLSAYGGGPRVVDAGLVKLDATQPLEGRLGELLDCLDRLVETHQPELLVCEALYAHYRHPRTAILMAHARGVVLALAARRGIKVLGVSATQVKKSLTGSGRADKAQIQRAVQATLRLTCLPDPHDVADAIAIALCGLRQAATPRALGSGVTV